MVERLSKEMRSKIMASIKGKDTKPEILLRKALFAKGYRYRLEKRIVARVCPDISFVAAKVAIFVDGCFWHKCPRCYREPTTNAQYWIPKLKRNVERDFEQVAQLKGAGWRVIRLWEHEVLEDLDKSVQKIQKILRK